MRYFVSAHFKKQLKPYLKKYRSLLDDIIKTLKQFNVKQAIPLGAGTYKLRVGSGDISKGKSHAFRMIVLLVASEDLVAPLILYFKGDRGSISKREILYHANKVKQELEK